jgi:hypothetical protein
MLRHLFWVLLLLRLGLGLCPGAPDDPVGFAIVQRPWFETHSAHFNLYSCGAPQDVNKLAARLEQFREAYTLLAGTQAVASPPIVAVAFPDVESMQPFLPLYQGKPQNLAGLFKRDRDENLIVLALRDTNSAFTGMGVIFHEYAHLLFRRNACIWPLWLQEGMAEVYSTFETSGYIVRIGRPIEAHLRLLAQRPLPPLRRLFGVTRESPEYNDRERQGMFYAQSWLLTHYLMAGGSLAFQTRFGRFTTLLHEGQVPEQAFTNALQTSLPAMEDALRRYLERGEFEPIQWALPMDLSAPRMLTTRGLTPGETCFRLGNVLLRLGRLDSAESFFERARKLAPESPLPHEGLGLLAEQRKQREVALREMQEAVRRGSTNFLAHFIYGRERYRLTEDAQGRHSPLKKVQAAEMRRVLQRPVALMPDFGPGHQLLGFFETVQGENLAAAEQHLRRAVELEPENQSYLISLAQVQMRKGDSDAARRTIGPLLLPSVEAELREHAQELMQELDPDRSRRTGRTRPGRK